MVYLIRSISDVRPEVWRALLSAALDRADQVRIYLPGVDLEPQEAVILALPGVTVEPWTGMAGAQMATGPVTPEARMLLTAGGLWSYEVSLGGAPLLRVEDFDLCLIWATDAEAAELRALGVDVQPVELRPEPGVVPVAMTDEELAELARRLGSLRPGGEE